MSSCSMATRGNEGGRTEDLFCRVGLDLVRSAVASASERTCTWGIFLDNL